MAMPLGEITIESSLDMCRMYVRATCVPQLKQLGIVTLGDLAPYTVSGLAKLGIDFYDAVTLTGLVSKDAKRAEIERSWSVEEPFQDR